MRVDAAVRDPTGAVEVEELDQASPPERFLSFVYARLLVSAAPSPAAVRRWAVAEAKRAWRRLDAAPSEELCEVARRMSYELEPEGTQVRIRLTDYLHLATPIREADFHLVRQAVRGGQVLVTQKRAARLVQEGVRMTLTPPVALDAGLRGALERTEGEFLKEIAERVPAPSLDRAGLARASSPRPVPSVHPQDAADARGGREPLPRRSVRPRGVPASGGGAGRRDRRCVPGGAGF